MSNAVATWLVLLVAGGCGAPREASVSNASATPSPATAPCGFTELSKLDRAAWTAVYEDQHDYKPLHAPRSVGSCLLHVDQRKGVQYAVRDGSREIALLTPDGTLLLVPMVNAEVGESTDVVRSSYPLNQYMLICGATPRGSMCGFKPSHIETNAIREFLLEGELPEAIMGEAAYRFFRNKTVRGVLLNSRVD